MIMRSGVVPGRYAGAAIPIHDGPTSQSVAYEQERARADGLAGRIRAAAAEAARSQYLLLELLGELDATGAIRHWNGFKVVGALVVVVVFDDSGGGKGTRPGGQGVAADADHCRVVRDGSVVVFEGAGGHPGRRCG
jgi:hypothetical protein